MQQDKMESNFSRLRSVFTMNVKLKNLKEDVYLRSELSLLDLRYRHVLRAWHQERDSLLTAHRKLVLLRVCEPKATVNKTMREISASSNGRMDLPDGSSSDARRRYSSKSLPREGRSPPQSTRQTQSALPKPTRNTPLSAKPQETQFSILQLKQMATIDCISSKELANRQQRSRGEKERLKQLQRDALQQKIKAFLGRLNSDQQWEN